MHAYSFQLYSLALLATIIIATVTAIVLWPRRKFKGVLWMILLEIAAAEWAFGILFESAATTHRLKELWSAIAYIGTCSVPLFFFLFTVEYYRGRLQISKIALTFLITIPIFIIILAFTNPLHNLLWPNITINPATNIAIYSHGIVWWITYVYEYALIIIGMYFLLKMAFKSGSFYTPHNLAIIIGSMIPIVGNLMYVFGPNPIPGLDWAPVGFALSGIVITWAILRLQLFKLRPIAHSVLVDKMTDGMIILDSNNIIVDINPASANIFHKRPKQMIGQKINRFLPQSIDLKNLLLAENHSQIEIALGKIQPDRIFELRLSILRDNYSQIIGKSLLLRDITEKKKNENEREKLIRDLQNAMSQIKTLSGLLPICAHCKKIRDDKGYWHAVEEYIHEHSEADFSHSICPDCLEKYYPEIAKKMKSSQGKISS